MADNALAKQVGKKMPERRKTRLEQIADEIQAYGGRVRDDFMAGAERSAQGLGDIVERGDVLTGIPRLALGGTSWMGAPVSAALSPVLGPILQPVGEAVNTYVGQPVEDLTGYPADITNDLAMTGLTLGAVKGLGVTRPYLARAADQVEGMANRAGYTLRKPANVYGSGPTLTPLVDEAGGGIQAKVTRLTGADTKRLSAIEQQIADLTPQAEPLRKAYQQALDAHAAARPDGVPRAAWRSQFQAPENLAPYELVRQKLATLNEERSKLAARMTRRETMAPIRAAAELYADKVSNMHKNTDLNFKAMSVTDYNSAPSVKVYKSPNWNGRQSSEYKVIMVDGRPAYARKSNHWGTFSTNVSNPDEAAAILGITREQAEQIALNDPFGRITKKGHAWRLEGGNEGANNSQAGYVFLDE
jgi:hypothetical protein